MEMGGERGRQGDASVFAQTYTIQPWVPVYNVGGDYAGSQASEGGRANTAYQTAMNQQDDWTLFHAIAKCGFRRVETDQRPESSYAVQCSFDGYVEPSVE